MDPFLLSLPPLSRKPSCPYPHSCCPRRWSCCGLEVHVCGCEGVGGGCEAGVGGGAPSCARRLDRPQTLHPHGSHLTEASPPHQGHVLPCLPARSPHPWSASGLTGSSTALSFNAFLASGSLVSKHPGAGCGFCAQRLGDSGCGGALPAIRTGVLAPPLELPRGAPTCSSAHPLGGWKAFGTFHVKRQSLQLLPRNLSLTHLS